MASSSDSAAPSAAPSDRPFHGQVAVVTGSSSGIGRAIAVELASAGADVVVHAAHSKEQAQATAEMVTSRAAQATVVMADISSADDRERLIRESFGFRGFVNIWINNAGADLLAGKAASWTFEEKLHRLCQVDITGTLCLARQAGERMRNTRPASLINIGWDQAAQGMAGDSGELFAAAKGAVMAFTRSHAKSLAPDVRVNCVAPGWIRTAWGRAASETWQERARHESLLDRWGTPEDVARAVRFLASPAGEFINGQVIHVNGGFRT